MTNSTPSLTPNADSLRSSKLRLLRLTQAKAARQARELFDYEACKARGFRWRLSNLYWILDKNQQLKQFTPNWAQARFIESLHTRNLILKARQRGFSTVIQLMMLDAALFEPYFRGVVTAQDLDACYQIFSDKFKLPYDKLPASIRERVPLVECSKTSIVLGNGSSVRVTTSARSGTVNMLHVSEMGKIAAKFPAKAREIMTGSLPAVPPTGRVFIESTAEGQGGEFYDAAQKAEKLAEANKALTPLDLKFHFYSWWDADEYRLDPAGVLVTPKDHEYFDSIERAIGRTIEPDRRAWYVKTREGLGENGQEKMWQEYPSTSKEAFQASTQGTYYANQFVTLRKQGRICKVPHDPSLPVYTAWDIGANDETAIWLFQEDGLRYRVIRYIEDSGEPFSHFVQQLKALEFTWALHLLPHDAEHKRQQGLSNKSGREMLQELAPGWRFEIVPRIASVVVGIQQTRDLFPLCWFDEEHCAAGLIRLENYRKEWDDKRAVWKDIPMHDANSNGADAFRTFAQARANGTLRAGYYNGGAVEPDAYPDY